MYNIVAKSEKCENTTEINHNQLDHQHNLEYVDYFHQLIQSLPISNVYLTRVQRASIHKRQIKTI